MKKVDRTIISILALALLTAVSGCNDKKDAKVAKTTSQSSGFSLKADMSRMFSRAVISV